MSPQRRQEEGCAGVCGDCLSKVYPQLKNHAEHCRGLQKEWTLGGDDPCDPSAREVGQGNRVFGGITGDKESWRPASQTESVVSGFVVLWPLLMLLEFNLEAVGVLRSPKVPGF